MDDDPCLTGGFAESADRVAQVAARFRVIDLFAGCGGLTKGFVDARHGGIAPFMPIAAVEIDRAAAATYAANFGPHIHNGDIADWVHREQGVPSADVVLGGPPCQGFSRLGSRDPRDKRNQLWRHYLDVVAQAEPQVFVMENVDAFRKSPEFMLLMNQTRRGGRLANYIIRDSVVSAADHGVPQHRKRTILVGALRSLTAPGTGQAIDELPEIERQALLIPDATVLKQSTVWETISHLVLKKLVSTTENRRTEVNGTVINGPFRTEELHLRRNGITALSKERYAAIPEGGNRFDIPERLLSPCWKKHRTGSGDVMGRLYRDRPSVTIRTEFFKPEKGRYLHPWLDRPITHLEAALLQSFPEDYLWCGSRSEIARQIGNAVPVGLARAIAEHLAPLLLAQPRKLRAPAEPRPAALPAVRPTPELAPAL